MKILHIITCACLSSSLSVAAQTPVGVWLTYDDETGEQKSQIEVYEQNNKLFGKIVHLSRASLNHDCDKCEGERKDKPILGMVVIENMTLRDGFWQDGRVLFPRRGKWYGCQFWLAENDPDILVVKGNWGPFYRTQQWKRKKCKT